METLQTELEILEKAERVIEEKKKPLVLLACYGTLRNGHGNWNWALKGKSDFLGTYRSKPEYTMYGKNQGFPRVTDCKDKEGKPIGTTSIVYDLFAVFDKNVVDSINHLEGCTGIPGHKSNWYDLIDIETEHGIAKMYVMHTPQGNEKSIIKSGNWDDNNDSDN